MPDAMELEDKDEPCAAAGKERKPYVLSRTRESWSALEHSKFQEALQLFHRDWKHIEAHVGTKSVVQIRSHAQKYFQKIIKKGGGAQGAIPPARPKRKAHDLLDPPSTTLTGPCSTSSQLDGGTTGCFGPLGGGGGGGVSRGAFLNLPLSPAMDGCSGGPFLCPSPTIATGSRSKRSSGACASTALNLSGGGGERAGGGGGATLSLRQRQVQQQQQQLLQQQQANSADLHALRSAAGVPLLAPHGGGVPPYHPFLTPALMPPLLPPPAAPDWSLAPPLPPPWALPQPEWALPQPPWMLPPPQHQQPDWLLARQLPLGPPMGPPLGPPLGPPMVPPLQGFAPLPLPRAPTPPLPGDHRPLPSLMYPPAGGALAYHPMGRPPAAYSAAAPPSLSLLPRASADGALRLPLSASAGCGDGLPTHVPPQGGPDLYIVYSYLGSLFDPRFDHLDPADHREALHNMAASDREAAVAMLGTVTRQLASSCNLMPGGAAATVDGPSRWQQPTRRRAPAAAGGGAWWAVDRHGGAAAQAELGETVSASSAGAGAGIIKQEVLQPSQRLGSLQPSPLFRAGQKGHAMVWGSAAAADRRRSSDDDCSAGGTAGGTEGTSGSEEASAAGQQQQAAPRAGGGGGGGGTTRRALLSRSLALQGDQQPDDSAGCMGSQPEGCSEEASWETASRSAGGGIGSGRRSDTGVAADAGRRSDAGGGGQGGGGGGGGPADSTGDRSAERGCGGLKAAAGRHHNSLAGAAMSNGVGSGLLAGLSFYDPSLDAGSPGDGLLPTSCAAGPQDPDERLLLLGGPRGRRPEEAGLSPGGAFGAGAAAVTGGGSEGDSPGPQWDLGGPHAAAAAALCGTGGSADDLDAVLEAAQRQQGCSSEEEGREAF